MSHQQHHLPQCDRVIILRGGCIVADGSFQHLQSQGYKAELGSGQGSGLAAELDDTAYDQGMAPTVSPETDSGNSLQVRTEKDRGSSLPTPLFVAQLDKAVFERGGDQSTQISSSDACGAEALLPSPDIGVQESEQFPPSEQQGGIANSDAAQQQDSVESDLDHRAANVERTESTASHDQSITPTMGDKCNAASKGTVQIPSSVFESEETKSADAKSADIPGGVSRVRRPFGTLSSRFSRRTSRASGSISGVPSMGGQMRTALSRQGFCAAFKRLSLTHVLYMLSS